jgi:hypothetical protein
LANMDFKYFCKVLSLLADQSEESIWKNKNKK